MVHDRTFGRQSLSEDQRWLDSEPSRGSDDRKAGCSLELLRRQVLRFAEGQESA